MKRTSNSGASEQRKTVSMAQVAEKAGVSQQTVSRVANGRPNVSDKTRERVERVMEELGFRPSYAGRSLRSGRYKSVGLCIYNITEYGNLSTLDGILTAARECDHAITLVEMGDNNPISLSAMSARMNNLPIDGTIMSMSIKANDFETFRPAPGVGTVLLTMHSHLLCTTVDSDQYGCSQLVMNYLFGRGHTHIRFVAGPTFSVDSVFRERGWRDALEARGLPVIEPERGDWLVDSGYEAGQRLVHDREMTAVYVANDQMALGVMTALRDGGRRVPEDVSVVGVDDSLRNTVPQCELTTVRFDLIERGRRAFEQAMLSSTPGYRPCEIRIPGTLVERASVADLR